MDNIINKLAENTHINWLKGYKKEHGNTPKFKNINGQQVNIVKNWSDLSKLWKNVQYELHKIYTDTLIPQIDKLNTIEKLAEEIHKIWMKENSWLINSSESKHLFCKYSELSEIEKNKDRNIAKMILNFCDK